MCRRRPKIHRANDLPRETHLIEKPTALRKYQTRMQQPSRRRIELDALRGLMLVWITCTHLPTIASTYVNQPFGFVSAAEGFIFLSALFTGRIYYRLAQHDGYKPMTLKLWARTVRLYLYHALLLAFVFLVAVPIASRGNRPGLHNLLDFYFDAGARRAVSEAFLLIYRPPLLDILPMYIIFLVFTSAALLLTRQRIPWKVILWTALGIWLMAQFGFRAEEHAVVSKIIPTHIPLNEMGSFDLWAWQFLWIGGIYLGVRWGRGDLDIEVSAKRLAIPAILIAVPLFELRRAIAAGMNLGPFENLFDKWHLGPIRLLNFAAVAVLVILLQSVLKPLAVRPLVWMGQASLQVFCVHLLFVFAGLTLLGNASMLTSAKQAALLIATFTAMLITAKIFSKTEAKQERQPKTTPTDDQPKTPSPTIAPEPIQSHLSAITTPLPAPLPAPGD
jgi:hypothetical protein